MVEITYQMLLSTVQTLSLVIGIIYYLTIMRNADKVRKTQLVSHISEKWWSPGTEKMAIELLEMEWIDFDDFVRNYDSTVNKDNYAKRFHTWGIYQEIGYMLYKGFVDIETVYSLMGGHNSLLLWTKFEPIILAQRKKYRDPSWFQYFEYFGNELKKFRVQQGLEAEIFDADGYTTRQL